MASTDPNDGVHSTSVVDSVSTIRERLLTLKVIQHVDLETAEDFAFAISPFGPSFRNCVPPAPIVFRGIDKDEHDLIPSAFRPKCQYGKFCSGFDVGDGEAISVEQQIKFELNVLRRFFRFADSQGLPLPGDSQEARRILNSEMSETTYLAAVMSGKELWPPPLLLSIMGLAQHHGIPTRLLDWSRNPFKAAYFAARKPAKEIIHGRVNPDNRIAVWAMTSSMIEAMSVLTKHNVGGSGHFPVSVVTCPGVTNVNLRAQEAVFSLYEGGNVGSGPLIDRRPLEVQVYEDIDRPEKPRPIGVFTRFTLPWSEAGKLLWILASFGVSAASLFPGFEGAAEAVQEENLWKKPQWCAR